MDMLCRWGDVEEGVGVQVGGFYGEGWSQSVEACDEWKETGSGLWCRRNMTGGMEEKQCVYFQNQLLVHGRLAFGVKQPMLCRHWCSGYLNNSYADKEFLFSALVSWETTYYVFT